MSHDTITDYDITDAMMTYGGGFVSSLGRLYRQADADNQYRLRLAFSQYFEEYAELVRVRRRGRVEE